MKLKSAALVCLLLALTPQGAASAQPQAHDIAEGFREGPLECFSSKSADEQGCDREAFEFPQDARAEGWFIILQDRDHRNWYFRRADVMLSEASEYQTPVRVPGNDTESGVRQ